MKTGLVTLVVGLAMLLWGIALVDQKSAGIALIVVGGLALIVALTIIMEG